MLHMIKLCVGVSEIAELEDWQAQRLKQAGVVYHVTRMVPRRRAELLNGGSLYWVIKGAVQVRQPLRDIELFTSEDGIQRCRLIFEPQLTPVRPVPRRAFQGWRYLNHEDAPPDLDRHSSEAAIPEEMRAELAQLGLI